MPPISLMLKPSSSACNLRCEYCFYHSLSACRELPCRGFMTLDTLDDILNKAFKFTSGNDVMLAFQGGEPLLSGKDFFRGLFDIISKYNVQKSRVYLSVQTNGTLIDDEWCQLFKAHDVLVGLSLDGDKLANRLRVFNDGTPSFDKVIEASKLLQKHKVDFNILTVLTKQVAKRINDIYTFFTSQGFKHLQFIPCLKPLNPEEKFDTDYTLSADDYDYFLRNCFNLYLNDYKSGNFVSVRNFDNLVKLAHFQPAEQCGMNGHCTHQYVIEADGEVFPCDFYCIDKYSLGNIRDTDFLTLEHSAKAVEFIKESLVVEDKCKKCAYFQMCKNGCKRERTDVEKCEAYKKFFPIALPHLKRMS